MKECAECDRYTNNVLYKGTRSFMVNGIEQDHVALCDKHKEVDLSTGQLKNCIKVKFKSMSNSNEIESIDKLTVEGDIPTFDQVYNQRERVLTATMTVHEDSSTPNSDMTIYNDDSPRDKKIEYLVEKLNDEMSIKVKLYERRLAEMSDAEIEREWRMTKLFCVV